MNTHERTERATVRKEQRRVAATVATFPWGAVVPLAPREARRLWDATAMVASLAHLDDLAVQIDSTLGGAGWERDDDRIAMARAADTIADCVEYGHAALPPLAHPDRVAADWRQRAESLRQGAGSEVQQ